MSIPIKKFMTEMPHTVGSQVTIDKAQAMMKKYACHHLPVLEAGKLVGIISDRDLTDSKSNDKSSKIRDIMTDDPVTVDPSEDVFQVAMLMHEKKIGSVIVSATTSSPWGIFTATDALKYLSKNHKTETRKFDPNEYSSFE